MSKVSNFADNYRNILKSPSTLFFQGAPDDSQAFTRVKSGKVSYLSAKLTPCYDLDIGPILSTYVIYANKNWKPAKRAEGITLKSSFVNTGLDYLPWEANGVTFRLLNPGSRLFFTGPLEGCYVFAVHVGVHWYTAHVNANEDNASAQQNDRTKRSYFETACELMKSFAGNYPMSIWELTPADYKPANLNGAAYRAFAFGVQGNAGWSFHFHSISNDAETGWSVATAVGDFRQIE
jgi:hypothetical protein